MQITNSNADSSIFEDLALLYEYPTEDLIPVLSLLIKKFSSSTNIAYHSITEKLKVFFDYCSTTNLSKLEEDYIASFEMNTKFVLYLGHLLLGENYERSEFISQLKDLYDEYNFKIENNELPDHISLILKFLSKTNVPQNKKNILIENLIEAFSNKTGTNNSIEDTYLVVLDDKNKYPIIYYLLFDLVLIFKIWEVE